MNSSPPLPRPGPLGQSSPVSQVILGRSDSRRPFRTLVPSRTVTAHRALRFAPRSAEHGADRDLVLVTRNTRTGIVMSETAGPRRFLGTPGAGVPCSSTPVRGSGTGHRVPDPVVGARRQSADPHNDSRFRSSVARPASSLSTLHPPGSTPCGCKTRFRPLARLYRTGLVTRRGPSKGFSSWPSHVHSPFPSLPPDPSTGPGSRPLRVVLSHAAWRSKKRAAWRPRCAALDRSL